MGRSRGGLTTKIHALVDAEGRPIQLKLTEGQAHDGRSVADMFETIAAGNILLADRAYDSDALRMAVTERGAWANIRAMPNRVKTFPFSQWVYRQRNAVERFFNKLKHFRAVTNSNTSGPSQRDMTNATTTSLQPSSWRQSESGCVLMSRGPSADYQKLADSTKRNWGPWLDRIADHFGELSVAQFDRAEKIRPVIRRWRANRAETPRAADYGMQVLSRVCSYAVDPLGRLASNPCHG